MKILSEQNQRKTVNEICCDYGIGQPTFYKWKSKYGGMEAHQLAQLKELEKQLSQYKKIVYSNGCFSNGLYYSIQSKSKKKENVSL